MSMGVKWADRRDCPWMTTRKLSRRGLPQRFPVRRRPSVPP